MFKYYIGLAAVGEGIDLYRRRIEKLHQIEAEAAKDRANKALLEAFKKGKISTDTSKARVGDLKAQDKS